MKKRIVVFGSFAVDLMARATHLPVPGETVKGHFFQMGAGGKGFNQGVAAHKSGGDVVMVTKVGKDAFAKVAKDTMKELGMNMEYLMVSETHSTGVALIMVDESTAQNAIMAVPSACANISEEDILNVKDLVKESGFLLTQLETNLSSIIRVTTIAKEAGVKVILNTAPILPMEDDLLRDVYLITPNEVEAQMLSKIAITDLDSANRAADFFFKKGVENVLITLGHKGAYIHTKDRSGIIPAYAVNAIDTTGAGDAFNGGLVTALSEGKDIWDAAKFANAVAALSVQKVGAATSMPSREEVERFLKDRES